MIYLESDSTDPAWNLALEEFLFTTLPRGTECLFLWQNDRTIVVGKNQNTRAEIDEDYIRERQIRVVRRLSGGGAVYHDLGNLNYTFIADRERGIDFQRFCNPLIDVLRSFGVEACLSGRNDLMLDGKKFSGNAQYFGTDRVLHHGTVLFSSDLEVLTMALRPDPEKFKCKGIHSASSRVTNLEPYLPAGTTVQDLKKRLAECFMPLERLELSEADRDWITRRKQERYDTWEWNYGYSPQYECRIRRRLEGCGTLEISFSIKQGVIQDLRIRGDFFGVKEINTVEKLLTGCRCNRWELMEQLEKVSLEEYIMGLTPETLAELLAG